MPKNQLKKRKIQKKLLKLGAQIRVKMTKHADGTLRDRTILDKS
jgi:hypothetical protein